jgi:hypothetical protein
MPREIMYRAQTKSVTINTQNSNLDGTGPITSIITAASNGTLIKTLIIKAQVSTTQGMIRLYVNSGGQNRILSEINVSSVAASGRDDSFYKELQLDYFLKSGDALEVSTQTNDTLNIYVDALDVSYYPTYREDTIYYVANTGVNSVSVANANLDGTGTIVSIITGAAMGTLISSIIVKGQMTTNPGMVRFFSDDSGSWKLFAELPIPAVIQGATEQSFVREIICLGGMTIGSGVSIGAATDRNETFSVIIEGTDWDYLP